MKFQDISRFVKVLPFFVLTLFFCTTSAYSKSSRIMLVFPNNVYETSCYSDTPIHYTQNEIDIMNNVAWEWRNAYDDVIYSLKAWSNYGVNGSTDNGMPSILNGQRHNSPVQHLYADYSISMGPEKFYELVCSSAYPDHPSNLNLAKQFVDNLRTTEQQNSLRPRIKSLFDNKKYSAAMWTILINISDRNVQETMRATFRDNRNEFIALFN